MSHESNICGSEKQQLQLNRLMRVYHRPAHRRLLTIATLRLVHNFGIPSEDRMRLTITVAQHTSTDMTCTDRCTSNGEYQKIPPPRPLQKRKVTLSLTRPRPWFGKTDPVDLRTRVGNRITNRARYRITILSVQRMRKPLRKNGTHARSTGSIGKLVARKRQRDGSCHTPHHAGARANSFLGSMSFARHAVSAAKGGGKT